MNGKNRKFDELSNRVIGAALDVHKKLGSGFIENIYHNALKIELNERKILFESERTVRVYYNSKEVGFHRTDLVIENEIIVELKTVSAISDVHRAQARSYLNATGLRTCLILNFSTPTLDVKRVDNNNNVFTYSDI